MVAIKGNKSIVSLSLQGYSFKEKTIEKLCEMLLKNKILRNLSIDMPLDSDNRISQALLKNHTLVSLEGDCEQSLKLIVEANAYMLEHQDSLRACFEDSVSSPRKLVSLPSHLEQIVKQKIEIRR